MTTTPSINMGAVQSRTPQVDGLLQKVPAVAQRLHRLTYIGQRLTARHEGLSAAAQAGVGAKLEASAALTAVRNARFESGGVETKLIEQAEAELARVTEAVEEGWSAATAANDEQAHHREALDAVTRLLNRLPRVAATRVRPIAVTLQLKDGRFGDVIDAQRDILKELRAKRSRIIDAPIPRDEAEAMLLLEASELAKGPGITVSPKGARLVVPEVLGTAAGDALTLVSVADAFGLVAWANPELVADHIRQKLDRLYANVDGLSARDRRQALAEMDAQVLAAERLEVEAILAARNDVGLRADVSPWAVLGIEVIDGIDDEYNDGKPGTARLN